MIRSPKPVMSLRPILAALFFSLALVAFALACVSAVRAQSDSIEATAPAPIVIDDNVLDDGNSTIIVPVPIPQPMPQPVQPINTPGNSVYVGIGAILFGVAAIIYAWRKGGNAFNFDANATAEIERIRANREAVTAYENALQKQTEVNRQLFGVAVMLIRTLAPLTPIEADDALGDLLGDIETPGAPTP